MQTPKFLLADNTQNPDELFIIHTEFPRFIVEVESEEVDWWDDINSEEENVEDTLAQLVQDAYAFLEQELTKYEEEEENGI